MPDDKKPPAKGGKKILGMKPAVAAGVGIGAVVLGVGYFWMRNRAAATGDNGTDAGGGTAGAGTGAAGGTDMGEIIQTVQGPPGPAGKQGRQGHPGKPGKPGSRGPGWGKPRCPKGHYYLQNLPRGVPHPEGAKRRSGGGWCIPNKDRRSPQPGG